MAYQQRCKCTRPVSHLMLSPHTLLHSAMLGVQAPAFDASGVQLSRGQQLVREIYRKWRKQLQRYVDYRNLFLFLAFIALFLGVLYSQRDAHTSYQVHSTIASVVLPANNILQSSNDVYTWLSGLLQVRGVCLTFKHMRSMF